MDIGKDNDSPMVSASSFCRSDYDDEVEEKKICHSDKVSKSGKEIF